jgi:hypothetical protein
MANTDKARRDLFTAFEEALGTDNATTAMELLPHRPASELVTRTDMHAYSEAFRGEIHQDMAKLRIDLQRLMVATMATNVIAVVTALIT